MIPRCLEARHPLFRQGVVPVYRAGRDGVKGPDKPLVGFRDAPVKLSKMLTQSKSSEVTGDQCSCGEPEVGGCILNK